MNYKGRVVISFLGNFDYDSRCLNLHQSLTQAGFNVKVISFDWLTKGFNTRQGDVSVYRLKKKSSLLFYSKFKLILLYNLLKYNADYYFAEDVYTLPFTVIASKIKGGKVIYDSRELYGHLAGLRNKHSVQKLLYRLEKAFIRYTYKVITTGGMDSDFLKEEYKISNTLEIRNLPVRETIDKPYDFRKELRLPDSTRIFLYQGVVLDGRGLELIYKILRKIENTVLIIMGDGEHRNKFEKLASGAGISSRVFFLGKVPQRMLLNYTAGADLGFALIENISLSYYYALPNKLFEYIQAGVPVVVSDLPQMRKVVTEYKTGIVVNPENETEMIESVENLLRNSARYHELKQNCIEAAKELNWNVEINKLLPLLK